MAEIVRLRVSVLTLLAVVLLIGACGGSSKSATTSGSPTSATGVTTTTGGQTATHTVGTSTSKPTPPLPTTTTTSAPGSTRGSTPPAHSSGGGSTSARVPATFAIKTGGQLSPTTVSSPAFLAVQLTVASDDGKPHRVMIHTPALYSLLVSAHAASAVLIRGLRAGRYDIAVDGATRGALLIGGEPGP